jgi:16S rRNA (guanine527-N7)-methyltransferase
LPDVARAIADALAARGAPAPALAPLASYGELLLDANRSVNLTAARTPEAIAEQIADAFPLVPLVHGALVDVGAGGGLPGIPLAVLCGVRVCLIDATAKKVGFLARALAALGLEGEALAGRAETLGHDPQLRERFAHATARALGSAPAVIELTLPFVASGGTALLQRGRLGEPERKAARCAALALGGELTEELLAGGERRILIVTKRSATPDRFPRRVGIAQRRPLCTP